MGWTKLNVLTNPSGRRTEPHSVLYSHLCWYSQIVYSKQQYPRKMAPVSEALMVASLNVLNWNFEKKKPINFATSVYINISNKLCVYHLKCNTKFVELHFLLVNQTFLLHMIIMASNLIISITFCPLDIRYYLFLLITSFDWEEAPLYILKWYRIAKLISLEYLNTTN